MLILRASLLLIILLLNGCYSQQIGSMQPYHPYKGLARANAHWVFVYLHQGYTDKAMEKLNLALRESPNDPVVLDTAGYFYEKTGNLSLASGYYASAMNVSPDSGIAKNNYAAFLCRNGDYAASIPLFLKAAATPDTPIKTQALRNANFCRAEMQSVLGENETYAYYTHIH
jgi:type IV pilus assembly protein PilF